MPAREMRTNHPHRDFSCCSGCGLCLLVCPVWRREHDIGLSPLGRAKALQHGASAADIAASVHSCTLCGACEPVCPEEIGLVQMTQDLRRQLPPPAGADELRARMELLARQPAATADAATLLLPGAALRAHPATLARAAALLGGSIAQDDGDDIALALEAGVPIPATRLERFLQPLRRCEQIVCADGLLLRHARNWLPRSRITSLGAALSRLPALRGALRASDLYVIEARAYHADYQLMVGHYDALRAAAGCTLNLDLQRIAIPPAAPSLQQRLAPDSSDAQDDGIQACWILQGRSVARIVVESPEDGAVFARASALPVVHLADLADDVT